MNRFTNLVVVGACLMVTMNAQATDDKSGEEKLAAMVKQMDVDLHTKPNLEKGQKELAEIMSGQRIMNGADWGLSGCKMPDYVAAFYDAIYNHEEDQIPLEESIDDQGRKIMTGKKDGKIICKYLLVVDEMGNENLKELPLSE